MTPATPFPTRTTVQPTYSSTWTRPTPNPDDRVCLIYTTNIVSASEIKKTAELFTLKNPPMYIQYSLTDVAHVSGSRQVVKKYTDQGDTISYNYVDPMAYLEITVRNRTTGEIYTQDGFGKGYGVYLKKTFKVFKPDDLLIEIGGYKLSGTIGIWVKPVGNLENSTTTVNIQCKYPQEFGSSNLDLASTSASKS